jgi:hypothetical protein
VQTVKGMMTMTTLRALVVQSLQAQILLASGHDDPLWRSSRHCGLCPDFGVGFSIGMTKDKVAPRYLAAQSFDCLVMVCRVLLDEAESRRDFSAAAALLQVCTCVGCTWQSSSPSARPGVVAPFHIHMSCCWPTTHLLHHCSRCCRCSCQRSCFATA